MREESEQSINDHEPNNSATVHFVLKNRTREEILQLLQQKIDSSSINDNGDSVLHTVFRNEKLTETDVVEILILFLTQGVNPNIENIYKKTTLLQLAVERRMEKAVNFLIKFKANIHAVNERGNSIAHFFIKDESEKCKLAMRNRVKNTAESIEKIVNDSVGFLKFLMSKGVDFDQQNEQGQSSLHLAIAYYLPHILPTLLEHTKDILFIDKDSKTLLEFFLEANVSTRRLHLFNECLPHSVRYADECVKTLLERGVPVLTGDKYGCRLLSKAIKEKVDKRIIETLISYYLNNCADKSFAMALFYELINTCPSWSNSETDYFLTVLRDLIVLGANVNNEVVQMKIMLAAIEAKNVRPLALLRENGVDFKFRLSHGKTPMHLLAEEKYYEGLSQFYREFCDLLVGGGCEVLNAADELGKSALHTAAGSGNVLMAQILIELGAEVNKRDGTMKTPLHEAVMTNESLEMIILLLASGADVNAVDHKNETPLHIAASNKNASITLLLIERGASVSCKDNSQQTPLHRSLAMGDAMKMVELLLASGADLNVRDDKGVTSLHLAISNNSVLMVELLLASGADINACKDDEGNRPLHWVFKGLLTSDSERILTMLLKKGAYVNARNSRGESALFNALSIGNQAMVDELLMYGANVYDLKIRQLMCSTARGKRVASFLRQYWFKLKEAKLLFDEAYRADIDENNVCNKKYGVECWEEIEKLESTFIADDKSLYDFLHMHPTRRGDYVDNQKLQQLVESPILNKQFPIYSNIILGSYCEAVTRKALRKPAKKALNELTCARLTNVIDQILAYLTDVDLISTIDANDHGDADE